MVETTITMLQLSNDTIFANGKTYKAYTQLYLPDNKYNPSATEMSQEAVIQQLQKQINKEIFYTITDVKTGEITNCLGIQKWLGYTDTHFSNAKYLHLIHPSQIIVQQIYAAALYELLIEKKLTFTIFQPLCSATIALVSQSGKYYYCKKQCYPFQLTMDHKMNKYLCEFTIIKEFDNEPFQARIYHVDDAAKLNNELFKKKAIQKFEEAKLFSIQELRILKRYTSNESMNSEKIAKAFKIEKTTVDTYNKRILKKAESLFGKRFSNAKLVAAYLKSIQLIY